jgi:hypothetical protein
MNEIEKDYEDCTHQRGAFLPGSYSFFFEGDISCMGLIFWAVDEAEMPFKASHN